MSRSAIFRVPHGIAVEMTERVYKLPSFNGIFAFFLICCIIFSNICKHLSLVYTLYAMCCSNLQIIFMLSNNRQCY